MDAAFKKTALILALALLAATPRLAQAVTPTFTSPPAGFTYQLVSGTSTLVSVAGSGDTAASPVFISFRALVSYASGDQPWLKVGTDTTATPGGLCSGGSGAYNTPISLSLQLGCNTPTAGTHQATVTLIDTGGHVVPITFYVSFSTGGGSVSAIVASPTTLTGTNALSVTAGAQTNATVTLQTTSGTPITFAASANAGWLTISPFQGTVSSSTPATLTFTANAASLSAGTYTATGTVSYGSSQTLAISVSLTVIASAVNLSPNTLAWSYTSGAFSPSGSQNLTLTTPNPDPYTARISYPTGATATNWLLVNGANSLGGLVNGSIFAVSLANYATLATGVYTGTITVTDNYNPSYFTALIVTLTVSTTSSSLTVTPNPIGLSSADGYEQLVTVTSTVAGTLSVTPSSTNNWLSVSAPPASISAGVAVYLTVTANTSLSGAGVYSGSITVTVGSVSQQVTVNLTAGTASTVTASGYVAPIVLNMVAESGGSNVSKQVVFAGDGNFQISSLTTYTPDTGMAWLNLDRIFGTLTATGTVVTLRANPSSLAPGSYTATMPVAITANGSAQPTVTLTVNFVVTSNEAMQATITPTIAGIAASTGTMLFNAGGTAPTGTIAITTIGGSTALPISVTTDESWITASIQGGGTVTPATILVTATTSGMLNGLYAGNVIVTSAGAATLYVPVVVAVSGVTNPSGLILSQPSLTFSAQLSGGSPPNQSLTVSSSTPDTPFTAVANGSTGTGVTWLSISPSGGLTTNQAIIVSVNSSGLGVGTYAGNIAVAANGTTVNVPVNLVISNGSTPPPTGGNVTVSSSSLAFSAVLGAAAPVSQTLTVSSAAGSASVAFTAAAASTGNWLAVSPASGTTQTSLTVSVNQAGLSTGSHTGSITITPTGGTTVVVSVSLNVVSEPTFSVTPASLTFAYQAGSGNTVSPGQLTVTASGGTASFTVNASSTGNWLSVTPLSGSTATTATLAVQVSPASLAASATAYTGTITLTGVSGSTGTQVVSVSLMVTNPLPVVTAVLNAASFASGPVAPGEIVSIFGTQIGPSTAATMVVGSNGKVTTSLGGVTVSFSGYLAPLVYVSSTQINAIVPYELSGNKGPFVEVVFAGQKSNEPTLQLTTTAPGIFTLNGSGSGPGAILNADGSVNTQANPATAGSDVVIFMTGEGLTTPASVTGGVTAVNTSGTGPLTPVPQLAVSVMIGGQPAQVDFDGEAPFMVAGVMQVNAKVPASARSGANSITVQVGKNVSTSGVTVWVR